MVATHGTHHAVEQVEGPPGRDSSWSELQDYTLLTLIAGAFPWDDIAAMLGYDDDACSDRALDLLTNAIVMDCDENGYCTVLFRLGRRAGG